MNEKADVVVIGSGAAGSVMAFSLAKRGLKVVVLEKGAREDPTTFEHDELAMLPRLYKGGGLQMTKDHDVTIAQGCAVGGSTVINNAIWLRADLSKVLPQWEANGAYIKADRLTEAYEEIERVLKVSPISPQLAARSTDVFLRGCQALSIPAHYLANNREACIACGWCNFGCRYNRKTSMLVTFVPWAEGRGATFLDRCRDVRIISQNKSVSGVRFWRDHREVVIDADKVVVCAGAIGSSGVLLRSGISGNGRVGKGLHVLGGVLVTAETRDIVDGFDGIGLTCMAEADSDLVIETFFAPPVLFSVGLGGWFLTHYDRMLRYRYFAQAGVMVGTEPRGTVTLDKKGYEVIDLVFSREEIARLTRGIKRLGEIYFAGGAIRVLPATFKTLEFTDPTRLVDLDSMIRRPDDLILGSAHPQGGNAISENPKRGVVNNEFRVHGYDNLYVADASVFPTNIMANCQATVMAISRRASDYVAA